MPGASSKAAVAGQIYGGGNTVNNASSNSFGAA